jgi:glycosyltransferase involved in cell wall biosynthesis
MARAHKPAGAGPPRASIVVPTRERPDYLQVALASIAPQARAAGAELIVVDDAGPSRPGRALARRFGARYEPHPGPLGLNVARNTGVERSRGELVVFVDDDVQARDGWLDALLRGALEHPEAQVLAGAIVPCLEGRPPRGCGREGPPITTLALGAHDRPTRYAWGANMAIRREALEQVGPFDTSLQNGGDEQEWQDRLRVTYARPDDHDGSGKRNDDHDGSGKRSDAPDGLGELGDVGGERLDGGDGGERLVLYVADAVVDHRRSSYDARLRSLCRASFARGRGARRFDVWRGRAPSLPRELRTLAGCAGHVLLRRCPAGLTMVAHSAGRVGEATHFFGCLARAREAPAFRHAHTPPAGACAAKPSTAGEDFLSGESGTVGGLDGILRVAADALADAAHRASGRRLRLERAARKSPPTRSVLAVGIERERNRALAAAIRSELERSRHEVRCRFTMQGARGKFENLNMLLDGQPLEGPGSPDWLLIVDDDVALPRGFLDRFLFLAERYSLDLVQPAHAYSSHAAWRVTRRRAVSAVRETRFVEIGPLTAFARSTFSTLLPFPADLRMGWGLDAHWGALAADRGWRCGVVDALAIRHRAAPAASAYSREEAIAEARVFLASRPYLRAEEAQRTLARHRGW